MLKQQFTLYMENKPGELARITKKIEAAKINIEGISVANSADVALVQLVVNRAGAMRRILDAAGIPFTVQQVASLPLENRPGALARLSARLAARGININYVYATANDCRHKCKSFVVISTPDAAKLMQLMRA